MATMRRRLAAPPVSELDHDDHPDEPAPQEDDEADVVWKHLSAADVQAKLNMMFSTEAVVFVSALLDALNADRPGLLYGSPVYRLDHRDQGADRDERGGASLVRRRQRLHLSLLVMLLRVSAVRLTVVVHCGVGLNGFSEREWV